MKGKKQIFIIVGLLILLLVVWTLVLRSPSKKNLKQAVEQAEEKSGLEIKVILELADGYLRNKENVQELSYVEDRDPFSSKGQSISGGKIISSKLFERLTLKGILWDSKNPLAIINEEVVGQGEMIEGIKIKKIEPNNVIVEAGGEEKTLFIEGVRREIKNKTEGLK